jgi:predicted dehydrogenase
LPLTVNPLPSMNTSQTRWGILATGGIARKMGDALNDSEFAHIQAVASRNADKARAFATEFDIPSAYGSYEELLNDPAVEVVYIATPHPMHKQWIIAALQAGKHVLCEKPLTMNAQQTEDCILLARQKGLFLMEALWSRFFPLMDKVRELLAREILGELRYLQADFTAYRAFEAGHRLFAQELGGGALLDLGIYPISIACHILGLPDQIHAQAQMAPTGVDNMNTVILEYTDGKRAVLNSGFLASKPCECFVVGEKGYLKIHHFFHQPHTFTLHLNGQKPADFHLPYQGNGLIYETEEVHRCLKSGLTESPLMPLEESLAIAEIMDLALQRVKGEG